jgi:RHS repeat-associated protein
MTKAYDPYGSTLQTSGSNATNYGYTGEYTDPIGSIYLRARHYDTNTGRFFSRDTWGGNPYDPMSLNRWNYVSGNPVNYIDPTGLWRWWMPSDKIYHLPIENYYMGADIANRQLEYPIPLTPFRHPDMFNSSTGDVYEIEPIYLVPGGVAQVMGYVNDLNNAALAQQLKGPFYDWNRTVFHIGIFDWPGKYRAPFQGSPVIDLVADYVGGGVVAYWLEPSGLLLGTALASYLATNRLANEKKLLKKYEWQPAYATPYVVDLTCGMVLIFTGAAIIVATLVEDVTLVGIVDDIATVPAGAYLINTGLRLTFIVP